LAIGNVPVTPVVSGSPVAFVRVREVGVSSAGEVSEGEVDKTTLPEPVVDAAETAVPFPCKIPVTEVERVIAGVVVAVATVPARPLAETTETDVTVPPPDVLDMVLLPPTVVTVIPEPPDMVIAPVAELTLDTPEPPPLDTGMSMIPLILAP